MGYLTEINVFILNLGWFLALLVVGYGVGRVAEKRHYRSILQREAEYHDLIMVVAKTVPASQQDCESQMVLGSVVVSMDYFKKILGGLRMIFGGRVQAYESLLDRARREALLRMQEKARKLGAHMIFSVRLETSSISKDPERGAGTIEVLAYGTALYS